MTPGPGCRSASWGPGTQTQGFSLKVKVLISPAPAQHRVKCPTVIASAIHQMCDVFNLISLTLISAARPPGAKTDQDELRVIRHLRCPGVRMTSGAARKSKYSIETSGTRDQTPWPHLILTPVIANDLLRDCAWYLLELNILDLDLDSWVETLR